MLDFFETWEVEAKKKTKSLMSPQCREDLASTILGFLCLCQEAMKDGYCLIPGRVNSDVVENT